MVEAHELHDVMVTIDTPWDELKYRKEFLSLSDTELEKARVEYERIQRTQGSHSGGLPWFPFTFTQTQGR